MRVSLHCQGCAGKVKKHLSKMEGRYLLLGVGYNSNICIQLYAMSLLLNSEICITFFSLIWWPTQIYLNLNHGPNLIWQLVIFFYLSITTSNPPNFTQSQPHFQLLYYLTSKYKWLNLNFVKEGLCRCWILFQRCSGYS